MADFLPGTYSNNPTDQAELERDFIRIAQEALQEDEAADFGAALDEPVGDFGEEAVDQEDAELPNLDTDADEMESIKNLIPWDNFVIIFDPHYSKLLEETNSLPPAKAKAKSYYIYFSPENKRLEGVVNKRYIGGYGTKEDLGEDFAFLKTLSPEGFAPDWKDLLLTDIDELPAVENERIKEHLRLKNLEKEEKDQEDDRIDDFESETGDEELNEPSKDNTVDYPSPEPVGKADFPAAASIKDIQMRRKSRLVLFKKQ